MKNELVLNIRNCGSTEAENWSGYLSENSHTRYEKNRLDFLILWGRTSLGSKNIAVGNLKKVSHTKRPKESSFYVWNITLNYFPVPAGIATLEHEFNWAVVPLQTY